MPAKGTYRAFLGRLGRHLDIMNMCIHKTLEERRHGNFDSACP